MSEAFYRAWRLRMRIPILLAALYLLPGLLMPLVFMDLRSVWIADAKSAMASHVVVDRSTNLGGMLRFKVEYRGAKDNLLVCNPRWSQPHAYRPGLGDLIIRPLWWWHGGKGDLWRCASQGLHDGEFYATTCHELVALSGYLSLARRCVDSNVFRLGDPTDG